MSKYFAISFCSHIVLLGLLLLENGTKESRKNIRFPERYIVFEITPAIENIVTQENVISEGQEVDPRETSSLNNTNEHQIINQDFTTRKQNYITPSYDKILSKNEVLSGNDEKLEENSLRSFSKALPDTKLKVTKKPDLVKTRGPNLAAKTAVLYSKISTPTPKPRVRAVLRKKKPISEEQGNTSDESSLKHPLINDSLEKNTTPTSVKTSAILKFNNEFMPRLNSSKNAQFSTRKMPKQNNHTNPLLSLNPGVIEDQAKQQCKLMPRQKTKAELNIRKIQNQIKSRGITISNILNYKPPRRSNEISISSLLASDFNTPSHVMPRPAENIGFLLTYHSFHDHTEDIVCEPK